MIYKRIIACLDVKNNKVVKGTRFVKIKKFCSPLLLSKKYNKEKIDEIIFLNINKEKINKICFLIKKISKNISVPLTYGGNINNMNEVNDLFKSGADKLSFNSTLYYNKKIINKIKNRYGTQSIVASIDVKKKKNKWIVYIDGGKKNTKIELLDWVKIQIENGIGELLVTSIDKDGTNSGYDIKMIKSLKKINVPIIASGGGGLKDTIIDLFKNTLANSALLASVLHKGTIKVFEIKNNIKKFFFIR
ncbi:imidazole glycerol phosphate synthase subunit HisF [Candidatus Vidania fulgoroideorum]